MHDFSAIYHYRLPFSEEEQCNPPIRKFWPECHDKNVLHFISSAVITSASRAKEPLVSQLLHSEQAPKWCIIISTIPVRLYFQSCSLNHQRKIPITIKLRSWFYPAHACVIYHFGVIKQKEIRKEIDRKLCSDTNEWSYHVERKYMRTLEFISMLQRISINGTMSFRCSRTRRCVWSGEKFGRINVGTIVFILTLIETRPRTKSGTNCKSLARWLASRRQSRESSMMNRNSKRSTLAC